MSAPRQQAYTPTITIADKVSLALRKELLRRRGLIAEAHMRAPDLAMPASLYRALDSHLGAVDMRMLGDWAPLFMAFPCAGACRAGEAVPAAMSIRYVRLEAAHG